ncbi:hypothetical protein GCM10011282_01820 [Undibacterium macrobrachii]|jgi:hypothetical protein|uniref:Uncharacterized protein n=2 Tax=Undibacterium macrobrachii TaxID=1119058 RepID=A0ABQ2X4Q6_9BURK|nr:hypothetical protein GCM10011282_01820 [Undibacterium macrobrachii]
MIKKITLAFILGLFMTVNSHVYANEANEANKLAIESDIVALEKEFSRGSISSSQLAEAALSKLDLVQGKLQTQLQERESACLDNFFTNSCLQEVRLKRRELQEILRAISVEAKSFLRRARADRVKPATTQEF